jgi:cystathionine beta-lyase/cystathionine gamma-synthase
MSQHHPPSAASRPANAADQCPRPDLLGPQPTQPLAAPIYPTSVWICSSTDQADRILGGVEAGYVYQRDRHPNADLLAAKCRELEGAEEVAITSSGMAALALALLSQTEPGDHLVVSNMLYGRSQQLLTRESSRWGISSSLVDTCDLSAMAAAMTERTKLIVVETIANPCLQVADLSALAELAHRHNAALLVDNTFATPVLCQPLSLGADWVMESVSKLMNGHSDVMLGLLAGSRQNWERVPLVSTTWGLASAPFDCWLATRGLATMPLRVERACDNALSAAEFLSGEAEVELVDYPGLPSHPQHALAARQLGGRFGSIVTFRLRGGRPAANAFVKSATRIPFCPSLGEAMTTLSHPESTSHRALSPDARAALGITGGTIRLSCGIESAEFVRDALAEGLRGVATG